MHISYESTGPLPSCRGGNSLNYTHLGNLNPVHLLCKSDKGKTYPKGNFQQFPSITNVSTGAYRRYAELHGILGKQGARFSWENMPLKPIFPSLILLPDAIVTLKLNNMKKIDIAAILSPDLKSRMRAQDLKALIENSGADVVEMDFQGVKFATRSFIDEFYNLFLKTPEANTFRVELINVPSDIKAMLDSVSRTQVRAKVIPSQSQEVAFKDVKEFLNYFSTVVL